MTALLQSRVALYRGSRNYRYDPAVLELDWDDNLTLSRLNSTGEISEVVFMLPLRDIRVGGNTTILTFTAEGSKYTTDFSPRGFLALAMSSRDTSAEFATRSGVEEWLSTLAELGYPTTYLSARSQRRWLWLSFVPIVVIVIVAALFLH